MTTPVGAAGPPKEFFLNRWDKNMAKFFHTPIEKPVAANLLSKSSYQSKNILQKSGQWLNNLTYKVANPLGKRMVAAYRSKTPGMIGKLIGKSETLKSLSKGLAKLGTKPATRMPGISTLFGLITAGTGLYNAAKYCLKGQFKEAGHEVLKTAGSTAGVMASMAVFVPGVNIIASLAICLGIGYAGDYIGKKIADTVFPSVAKKKEEAQKQQKEAQKQQEAARKIAQSIIAINQAARSSSIPRIGMYG